MARLYKIILFMAVRAAKRRISAELAPCERKKGVDEYAVRCCC